MLTSHELRKKYLEFFSNKGHKIIDSASLIPENDPTTLFTSAGMQPMIPYLLGESHPNGKRIANSQKCFRTQDIDEVGDNRHTTFFEMLGNWSLGDYFKQEQVGWMFDFLINEIHLDPQNLYITCFAGKKELGLARDDESAKFWQEKFKSLGINAEIIDDPKENGLQNGKIFYYGENKNWWSRAGVPNNMPIGEPGGGDSEMFWDFGENLGKHEKSIWKDKPCHPNCDCGRFVEIGNNVFMEYIKTKTGFEKLKNKNIDFGGGLERIASALQNDPDIFEIDLFLKAKKRLELLSGRKYGVNAEETFAFRVILDHLRASMFLIADGAIPSNKDQGYFTRRLLRRAIRFGVKLGIQNKFTAEIVKEYIKEYKNDYLELSNKQEFILSELEKEEDQFRKTLEKGLKEFERMSFDKKIDGTESFSLFSTYGFPYEMTEELAKEKNLKISKKEFDEEMAKHQNLSRTGANQKFKGGLADMGEESKKLHTVTHLLHFALRRVLGDHVEQKGSNITAERLRFDFSHPDKMTDEEKQKVEDLVNAVINQDVPITCGEMTVAQAKSAGAIGLFGNKYGEKVKVYTIGEFSKEICGGPHVVNTSELGHFKIKKEEASSAGVRRIKAVLE